MKRHRKTANEALTELAAAGIEQIPATAHAKIADPLGKALSDLDEFECDLAIESAKAQIKELNMEKMRRSRTGQSGRYSADNGYTPRHTVGAGKRIGRIGCNLV